MGDYEATMKPERSGVAVTQFSTGSQNQYELQTVDNGCFSLSSPPHLRPPNYTSMILLCSKTELD